MRYQADKDGRYPLSGREYISLCCVIGALHALITNTDELKERLELTDGGWDDMQAIKTLCDAVYTKMLGTIPIKKLVALRREMRYMTCETRLTPAAKREDADDVFISNRSLKNIVNRAISMDCTFCEKSRAACKKCALFKDISACYPFELGNPDEDKCPLSGITVL